MVLAFRPAARPVSTKLTPSGVPGLRGSTGCGVAGAACDHSGRAIPSTFSSDRTSADRLSDFRSSRREEDKKEYPGNRCVLDCAPEFLYFLPEDFASWRG